jgi:hypothetical protein
VTTDHREQQRAVQTRAAAAAAFVLGAKAQPCDISPQQGMRDFDLVFDDGHCEPLEVTQHMHEPTRHTLARLREGGFRRGRARPRLDGLDP